MLYRRRLLRQVRRRLRQSSRNHDPSIVLSRDALDDVAALLATITDPSTDLEVSQAAGMVHWRRFLALGPDDGEADFTAAITLLAPVYRRRPRAVPQGARAYFEEELHAGGGLINAWVQRANELLDDFRQTGNRAELDTVVDLLRRVLDALPADHSARGLTQYNLGVSLVARFEHAADPVDLAAAVNVLRAAVEATPVTDPNRVLMLSSWGAALMARFESAGDSVDPADLEAAITLLRAGVDATPHADPNRVMLLANLGAALMLQGWRTLDVADLAAATTTLTAVVGLTPADDPRYAGRMSNLGTALHLQYGQTNDVTQLDAAVTAHRTAAGNAPPGHRLHARCQASLGNALRDLYELTEDLADLDAAVACLRAAVDHTPPTHPDRVRMLSSFSNALDTRYEETGDFAALDDLIAARRARGEFPGTDPAGDTMNRSILGNALRLRFEHAGDPADLEAAVSLLRTAVDAAPSTLSDPSDRARCLSNFGLTLRIRFQQVGDLTDLNTAIDALQTSTDVLPTHHADRAGMLLNLGTALLSRFQRTGDPADLNAAVTNLQAAPDLIPAGHRRRGMMLANLGSALQIRFAQTDDPADHDAAVAAFQTAVDVTSAGRPDHGAMLANLGGALRFRFTRTDDPADLETAIGHLRTAVKITPSDRPDRAWILSEFASAMWNRFGQSHDPADLDTALDALRAAVDVQAAPPRIRMSAARSWGLIAGAEQRWQDALAGHEAAVDLLGRLAPRGLDRGDQEHLLAEPGTLGADAAACCVRAGRPERAVELFEQGRGVLLRQALDTRTDLTALAERHPGIARRFTVLRASLDQADEPGGRPAPARRNTAAAFDQLIAEIRELPGFDGFLRPPPVADLLAVAAGGPIVIVAVSSFGSCALIVTEGGVDAVPLPGLEPLTIHEQVLTFLDALDDRRKGTGERQLADVLGWLWDALAAPVLDRLGITEPLGEERPRLWWCVSSLLSFLPIHAAGHHSSRFDPAPATLIDRVISSYTPTVQALAHARRSGPADVRRRFGTSGTGEQGGRITLDGGRVLVVAMPQTPGIPTDLPGARAEAAELRQKFPGRVEVLAGPEVTLDAVLATLPTAQWAHFACHGTAEADDPSNSRLYLYDGPLTTVDIARLRLDHAELAFLSACETACPGNQLPDEAIHLASAFQLAGYRHVIATLWPIADKGAVAVAESIYASLASDGDVAGAVHTATRALRDFWPGYPSMWASHVHSGA
ncbi:CHAT domain-containing protein [Frankia sp. Cpl3]|nr:CHAT domain-containing protein [Frankia sp. Cpl3]